MFVRACELAASFTAPVVVSTRRAEGSVECGLSAFMIVNDEGWFVTAAHVLQPEPADMTNQSYWWGSDERRVERMEVLGPADLALGRIEPFDAGSVAHYPVFKREPVVEPGRSVCRLGFPFHSVGATFDEARGVFELAPGSLPVPRFPVEGILTRQHLAGTTDGIEIKFLETSSPGLRGQSGGPIFDVDGRVRGLQVRTHHLALGFSPELEIAGEKVRENQFLNAGIGVHASTILAFLERHGVEVATG
jgi:S1-C subfamily serine protease